jgi:hypothetical protein
LSCLGFSPHVHQQLALWKQRAISVVCSNPDLTVKTKEFVAKNGLPRLENYADSASDGFWKVFPTNKLQTAVSLISGTKLKKLAEQVGYPDTEMLNTVCNDLQHGADIGCSGKFRRASRSANSASAISYGEQVTDAVASWVKKRFVYGPIELTDLPATAKVSGIMCRPKPDGSVRVILNLSAPKGNSVNDGINSDDFPAVMSSTRKWLAVLELAGKDCRIMKLDWADAYKHIRVRPEDIDLQYFCWLGKAFAELCLIFGAASSVGIYDRTAKLVLDVVLRLCKFPRAQVCQHLDDICAAAAKNSSKLEEFETAYRKVASQIGVQLAPTDNPEKAFSPCTKGVVLGVEYDTVAWTWSIPHEKMCRLLLQIRDISGKSVVPQHEIWSLAGRLLHYAPLVPTGRFNIDHVIAANSVSEDRNMAVVVSPELVRQLFFWYTLLQVTDNLASIPPPTLRFPVWTRECYTDAAGGSLSGPGRGTGIVSHSWWAYVPWPRKINCGVRAADGKKLSRKLSALELVGPLIWISAGHLWCRNRPTRCWVDNIGSVRIWHKGYSTSCRLCTTLVKAISSVAAGIGCRFTIEKITRCSTPGAIMADSLSKADFNNFRRTALAASWPLQVGPSWVPPAILAWLADPVADEDLGNKILRQLSRFSPVLGYSAV